MNTSVECSRMWANNKLVQMSESNILWQNALFLFVFCKLFSFVCLRCLPDAPRKWLRCLPGRNPGDRDLSFGRFWQTTNHDKPWKKWTKVYQSEQNPGEAHESTLIQSIPSRQMHFRAASFFTHYLQRTFAPPWTSGFHSAHQTLFWQDYPWISTRAGACKCFECAQSLCESMI